MDAKDRHHKMLVTLLRRNLEKDSGGPAFVLPDMSVESMEIARRLEAQGIRCTLARRRPRSRGRDQAD